MHELGIMSGVLDAVDKSAKQAQADKVLKISLSIGVMTEAIEDSLRFAFEALTEGTYMEGADLEINMVEPRSRCLECGKEFNHDRFHVLCPECGSFATELLQGREMQIDSIEVDIPDDVSNTSADSTPTGSTNGDSSASADVGSAVSLTD
ncbi:MAG: hydrogenase maturation nickel metallochaperone HypA [Eggerthellaceae bacterium]|jgi:hydrogenase nickel incorporation protein HypA/HybF|nr:hydrogenase maturation nickel metallochaperone HypA [Eggerthellaceae bacterium]MCH4220836.1 hydrogenase maturation nickel metallochaperone HypA [Eggerthellaceae bacterium]